ncbi:MAG TPA: flagellar motor switch protein FliM [Bryobacteraceae bacterium]|nr:flagellar motor switch protein FliM [Bryobacteraceae bacterium]
MKRELSQQEIDAVFQGTNESAKEADTAAVPFDFGRLDKIPKSQLRAIHQLHENFVRTLVSSLSAYLRSYITLNLVSLEQISYAEFLDGVASPTCIAYIGLLPYDEAAVLELSPSLAFALVEVLLGGNGQSLSNIKRKITEIEKGLLQNLLRVIMQDLNEAWKSISEINFEVQSLASEPQLLHVLAPSEAVVAIAIEGRLGASAGMLNLAIPSIFFKRLRHRFEQQLRQVRRSESTLHDQAHMAQLIEDCTVVLETRLEASTISAGTLLTMNVGDVLDLDCPLHRQMSVRVNGKPKFRASMATAGDRLAVQIAGPYQQERRGVPAPRRSSEAQSPPSNSASRAEDGPPPPVNRTTGVLNLAEAVAHAAAVSEQ